MPTYSYKCSKCGKKFSIVASIQEREEWGDKFHCPKCGNKDIKKVFSLKTFLAGGDTCGGGGCCSGGCKK